MNATIMIVSESRDVSEIVSLFKEIVSYMKIFEFKFAVIRQNAFDFTDNENGPQKIPYPLKLYASNGLKIKVSEVRCGKHDERADALIEILKLAGFNLKQKTIDTIYNDHNVNFTLFMEEK